MDFVFACAIEGAHHLVLNEITLSFDKEAGGEGHLPVITGIGFVDPDSDQTRESIILCIQ
jgi:hypothetical protein